MPRLTVLLRWCPADARALLPLQDNAASQLAAKPALVPLLVLMQIPKVVEGPRDVDDLEQLAVAATDALSACLYNNPELQVCGSRPAWARQRC